MRCDCAPVSELNDATMSGSDCPPVMWDGRAFTDYRGKCAHFTGSNSFEARQYYVQNAARIMTADREQAVKSAFCAPCFPYEAPGTQLPETEVQSCDKRSCVYKISAPDGVGLGREQTGLQARAEGAMPLFPIEGISSDREFVAANEVAWV